MLVHKGQFFLVRRVGIVPLLIIWEAIPEGSIAGNPAVGSQAACGYERCAQINDRVQPVSVDSEVGDAASPVKGHLVLGTQSLLNEIAGQLDSEISGPGRLRPVREGGTLLREKGEKVIDNTHLPKALHQSDYVLLGFPHAHHKVDTHVRRTEDVQSVLENLPVLFPPVRA